jgi:hypothetical protein
MIRIALILNLITYSIVVSQPLAYRVVMGRAQRALSPAAFIELRQCINPIMTRRVPVIYASALATLLLLLVLSLRMPNWIGLVTTSIALLCLVIDVFFMLRANVPINGVIDQWSPSQYPEDWERYRAQWFASFAYREIALLVGFLSLLVGAVFQA